MSDQKLRTKIEEQVALEKRAHQHVKAMVLSECVEREFFQTALNEIMPGHYHDVVEERSISKLCGYPVCSNRLTKVSHQKYHISMKSKKIYDITERKLFCSSKCFKSSKFVESQISTDPLWLRNEKVVFEFLEILPMHHSEHEEKYQQKLDQISTQDLEVVQINTGQMNLESGSYFEHSYEDQASNAESLAKESLEKKDINQAKHIEFPDSYTNKAHIVNIDGLCEILNEWCTFDTYKFFKSKVSKDSRDECDLLDDVDSRETKMKSAKRFLKNNIEWMAEIPENNMKATVKGSKAFISPPVDSKSQNSIRRNIVSQKLRKSFSEVFSELCISYCDFQFDLFPLLKTFRLTSHNILLKPNEWKIMATAILHGFAKGDLVLQDMIDNRVKELQGILLKYGTNKDEFGRLLSILDQYVQNSSISKEKNGDFNCEYDNDSLD